MINYKISAYTRRGSERKKNEDACGVGNTLLFGKDTNSFDIAITSADLPFLVTLADGVGGHKNGDIASLSAVEYLSKLFNNSGTEFDIGRAIADTDRRIKELGDASQASSAMATTIVGAVIGNDEYVIFNVGDSPAYLVRGDAIVQLSEDDVWPGDRNALITQCLGGGGTSLINPHIRVREILSRDILLLVSDGISDVLNEEVMVRTALSGTLDVAFNLCQEAAFQGGGDDASAVICSFE